MGRRRRRIAVAVGAAALVVGSRRLGLRHLQPRHQRSRPPRRPRRTTIPPTTTTTTVPAAPAASRRSRRPAASTLVATTNGSIPGYASPAGGRPDMTVPGTWYGYPSVLPVIATEPGWLYVRLAQRPNGSTIWVRQSDVTLSSTPYYIVVDLTTMHLYVFDGGTQVFDFPAGIGAPDDPTPTGHYFMPMQYPSPGPGLRPLRPRHVGPLRLHHRLGELGRRHHRHPRADRLLRRLADRHHRRRHLPRVHPAARRRPGAALHHPRRHADRRHQLAGRVTPRRPRRGTAGPGRTRPAPRARRRRPAPASRAPCPATPPA